jgi:hypothetical protein
MERHCNYRIATALHMSPVAKFSADYQVLHTKEFELDAIEALFQVTSDLDETLGLLTLQPWY